MSNLLADIFRMSEINSSLIVFSVLLALTVGVASHFTIQRYPKIEVVYGCIAFGGILGMVLGAIGRVQHIW